MRGVWALVLLTNAALLGCAGRGGHTGEGNVDSAEDLTTNGTSVVERRPANRLIAPLAEHPLIESWVTSPDNVVRTVQSVHVRAAIEQSVYGRDVVVAVVDSGVDSRHPSFGGRVLPGWNAVDGSANTADVLGHGTHVAGIVAGQAVTGSNLPQIGVASAAYVLPVRVTNENRDIPGSNFEGKNTLAEGLAWASGRAHVINLSVSNENARLSGNTSTCSTGLGRGADANSWQCAANSVANSGAVWVVAAGNHDSRDVQPKVYAGFGAFASDPTLNGQMLVVGSVTPRYASTPTGATALDEHGELLVASWQISNFSDVPGNDVAKQNWFIVAPGEGIQSANANNFHTQVFESRSGTSMAAPLVSGAAALLLEKWPFLPASHVVDILLRSATDLGTPGPDPVFGRGLLNISNALNPVGALRIPLGESVSGAATTATQTIVQPSSVGNAIERSPGLTRILVLDEYQRDFYVDLTVNAVRAKSELIVAPITTNSSAVLGAVSSGHGSAYSTFWAPRRAFSWQDSSIELLSGSQSAVPFLSSQSVASVALAWGTTRLSVLTSATDHAPAAASFLVERTKQFALGSFRSYGAYLRGAGIMDEFGSGTSAFGKPKTVAAGASWRSELFNSWWLSADAHVGVMRLAPSAQIFTGGSALARSNALGLEWRGVHASAGLVWSQPLRVERGELRATVPVARTFEGKVIRESINIKLAAQGQENKLEYYWQSELGKQSTVRVNFAYRVQPDHLRDAAGVGQAGMAWEARW